jgi:hypothetical protein
MGRTQNAIIFASIMFAIGLLSAVVSFQYPADSSGFPRAISVLLIILSAAEFLRIQRSRRRAESQRGDTDGDSLGPPQERSAELRAALLVLVSAPVYILLARLFDFEIATFVYLCSGMWILGIKNPAVAVSVSVAVLVTVKLLFFTLLDVSRATTIVFGS